MSQAVATGV